MAGIENKLAIIIPAYKKRFIKIALESIANQSCKDFILYIGDDASPDDLYSIVRIFEDTINIEYKRFEENLGSVSLTNQWERCINMSSNEPYIWLFSDDDEMPKDAVENFYKEVAMSHNYDIYRYDIQLINEKAEVVREKTNYPLVQAEMEFFCSRINDREYSCITQFIFTRKVYNFYNGFVDFPFAWCSDDATILLYSSGKGIKKINSLPINWRLVADSNITSSERYEDERAKAVFLYAIWFNGYLKNRIEKVKLYDYTKIYLNKRVAKLSLKFIVKRFSLETIFRLLGFKNGIWVFVYAIYFRIKIMMRY